MPNGRILVVDDEPQILRALRLSLGAAGYQVEVAPGGQEALDALSIRMPDLIVLDLMMPGLDGLEVIRQVRGWSQVPVIVLSVRGAEKDKVGALNLGADDYIVKPFGIDELIARVQAALRRTRNAQVQEAVFSSGHLVVDFAKRLVKVKDREVRLTPTEYELLKYLVTHADKVLTHTMILEVVWGPVSADETEYLRVFVRQLRKKIEPDPTHPQYIVTEPGIGYRFRSQD